MKNMPRPVVDQVRIFVTDLARSLGHLEIGKHERNGHSFVRADGEILACPKCDLALQGCHVRRRSCRPQATS